MLLILQRNCFLKFGNNKTIAESAWPAFDEAKTVDDEIELPIQVNGKLRGTVMVSTDATQEEIKPLVHEKISTFLADKQVVKEIYISGKIYNIVVK